VLLSLALLAADAAAAGLAAGDHEFSITHRPLRRSYIVHVPPRAASGRALAVVINFHGGGANARNQQWYSRMDRIADREGFLAVYPNGSSGIGENLLTWNAGNCCGWAVAKGVDDVGFVLALLDDLARRTAVDAGRVYATGLSNGAMMAYRLAAEAPRRIAAVAGVAGAMAVARFAPPLPVPVLHIHSVDDERALYAGGLGPAFPALRTRVFHPPVDDMMQRWREHDGCPAVPRTGKPLRGTGAADRAHTATRHSWGPCINAARVVLWKLTGAGHVWPGGRLDYLPLLLGPGTAVIDANEEIWRFFSRFQRAQR
jgi:polyhydroxybutyrate depolymerase